ncbi:MAG: helix-turn-helix domain-containing protein [Syntrophales bacterium LBB04]|nr:helix-turn-helix domain-containing protein [Syntrophales bacterium LBB04]
MKSTNATFYTLAAEGKLRGFRIGNSWRFDMDEILSQINDSTDVNRERGGQRRKGRKEG